MQRGSVASRALQLPPMAFDGVLRAAANTGIHTFQKRKQYKLNSGTFLT